MRKTEWNMQQIQNWNKYRFPLNNKTKQMRKIEEEIGEYGRATTRADKLEELADVYIAFAGLSRFTKIGEFVCRMFEGYADFEELEKAVQDKMEINKLRKFDKDMHHVEPVALPSPKKDIKHNPASGIAEPEYITVQKVFHYWKQDENGNWRRVEEPYEFTVLKSDYYKWG